MFMKYHRLRTSRVGAGSSYRARGVKHQLVKRVPQKRVERDRGVRIRILAQQWKENVEQTLHATFCGHPLIIFNQAAFLTMYLTKGHSLLDEKQKGR